MSLKLNHSKDYHNLLDTAVENELSTNISTNESLWNKMGDQLEIEGIAKDATSAIMRKDIEDKLYEEEYKEYIPREQYHWHSGYYYRVMKKQGRLNPALSKSNQSTPSGESDNSSINTKNSEMLLLCDSVIDICKTIKDKSKESKSLDVIFGNKVMTEFYRQQNTMINNCKNAIDNKTKIPQNTEMILLECLATVMGNANKCGQVFQKIIMQHMESQCKFLTQKQASKFQSGGKQSQLYLLKPTSRDFAVYEGYTGIQCTCGSWRVRPKSDHTSNWECYDCEKIMPKQHVCKCTHCQIPLYQDRILHIIKTGKCENCNEAVDLPQILIDQANTK